MPPGASGFLAGRAIWLDAFQAYPDWSAIEAGLRGDARAYMDSLNALTDAKAAPWSSHSVYGGTGARFLPPDASFRHAYAEA